jgi:hypothetical protein
MSEKGISRVIIGLFVLFGGIIVCYFGAMQLGPMQAKPEHLQALKANKMGDFSDSYGGSRYKLCRVDLPDGSWYVVAIPTTR